MFPARMLYLSTLEASRTATTGALAGLQLSDAAAAAAAGLVGGGLGSLAAQCIVVPIDVVSQRLMLLGGAPAGASGGPGRAAAAAQAATQARTTGLHLAREIVRAEGVAGLYRGFGASLGLLVPNSAIWWSSYSVWQQV